MTHARASRLAAALVFSVAAWGCRFDPAYPADDDGLDDMEQSSPGGDVPLRPEDASVPLQPDEDSGISGPPDAGVGADAEPAGGGGEAIDEDFRRVPHLTKIEAPLFGTLKLELPATEIDTEAMTIGEERLEDAFRVFAQDAEGGGEVAVLSVDTLKVTNTVRVRGTRPLIIVARGEVDISGVLDGGARGRTPGPGGSIPGRGSGAGGEGNRTAGSHVGGGGAGGATRGAFGGAPSVGAGTAGQAGVSYFQRDLPMLLGGSGGGRGTRNACEASMTNGFGGAGGGAIQIFSAKRIRISGGIQVGGGGGEGGVLCTTTPTSRGGAGSGGGSGGVIDLAAPRIELLAEGYLAANGGGGGSGATELANGVPGRDGLGGVEVAAGGGGGPGDLGLEGGAGGARDVPPEAGEGPVVSATQAGGGGGGAVGLIRIVTRERFMPDGIISPR